MSLEVKVKKPDVGRGHVLLGTLAYTALYGKFRAPCLPYKEGIEV